MIEQLIGNTYNDVRGRLVRISGNTPDKLFPDRSLQQKFISHMIIMHIYIELHVYIFWVSQSVIFTTVWLFLQMLHIDVEYWAAYMSTLTGRNNTKLEASTNNYYLQKCERREISKWRSQGSFYSAKRQVPARKQSKNLPAFAFGHYSNWLKESSNKRGTHSDTILGVSFMLQAMPSQV